MTAPDPIVLTSTTVLRDLDGGSIPSGRYVWRGPAGDPVFAVENCRDVVSGYVNLACETPCEAIVVCERTRSAPGVIPSTNHGFTRWRVYGNGLAERGVWARATIDENNEHFTLRENTFYGCARPVVFEGQQSKHHTLVDNVFESFDVAVTSDSGFTWSGKTAAVGRLLCELTRVGDPVKIRDIGVEACGRLLETSGPTTASQGVTLDCVRYAADQLHPDGDCVVFRSAGPLTVCNGSKFGDGKQRIPRIALLGVGEQSVSIRDNTFGSFSAHRVCPVRKGNGSTPKVSWGRNVYQRDENDPRNTETRITWPEKAYA